MAAAVGGGRAVRAAAVAAAVLGLAAAGCARESLSALDGALEVPATLEFGAVSVSARKVQTLAVRNAGRAPVSLSAATLGPQAPDFALVDSPAPVRLGPGETATLLVAFVPAAVGAQTTQLTLATDVAGETAVRVEVRGQGVLGRVDADPARLDFGRVPLHTTAERTISLGNASPWPVEAGVGGPAGDDADFFRVPEAGALSMPPQSTRALAVAFLPARPGPHSATIALRPCPSCAEETIELRGEGISAALSADPLALDFGFVAPGAARRLSVSLRNLGTMPVQVQTERLGAGSGPGFALVAAALPVALGPGEAAAFEVEFAPEGLGGQDGTLRFSTDAAGAEEVVLALRGVGGGPRLEAVPSPLHVGSAGIGMTVEKTLSLRNTGHDPSGTAALVIDAWEIVAGDAEFSVAPLPAGGVTLLAGQVATVPVRFKPLAAAGRQGVLRLHSNDSFSRTLEVPLSGLGVDTGPCTWAALPEVLDFGAVARGERARLAFALRNVGPNPCGFSNVRLSRGTPPQFALSAPGPQVVAPGGRLTVPVTFAPDSADSFTGLVEFDTSSASAPRGQVPLVGQGTDSCLKVTPALLSFGTTGLTCAPPMRSAVVTNTCAAGADVSAEIGTGATEAFVLEPASTGTHTVAAGGFLRLDVTYAPTDEQGDSAPLRVRTSADAAVRTVGLEGRGSRNPQRTDQFTQSAVPRVDFLFVLDNSGSMEEEQRAIADNFDRFIAEAQAGAVDYRIAVTTTGLTPYDGIPACPGGVRGGEAGRFFPVDRSTPRILTPQTPDVRAAFARNVKVGTCHWYEQGLEAARLALSAALTGAADAPGTAEPDDGNAGFLREDALLYVLYVSDEDDNDSTPVQQYVDALRALKPGRPDLVTASAVVGMTGCSTASSVGNRYMSLVAELGGKTASICAQDWGGLLADIGAHAFQPHARFPLSETPATPDVTVRIDGNEVPAMASDGSEQWRFDPSAGDHGSVVFAPGHEPGGSTTLEITYMVTCAASGS